nr:MAG TPA: CcmH protein [Microviridae sp.]
MVTRMLAAGQEDEEIRNAGILYLNEQDVKR